MTEQQATQIAVSLVHRRGDEVRAKLKDAQPTTLVAYLIAAFLFAYGLAIIARPMTPSNSFLQQFIPLAPQIIGWFVVVWSLIVPVVGWLFDSVIVLGIAALPAIFLIGVNVWQIAQSTVASLPHAATGIFVFALLLYVLWLLERNRTQEQLIRTLTTASAAKTGSDAK